MKQLDYSLKTAFDDSFFYIGVAGVALAFNRSDIDAVIDVLNAMKNEMGENNSDIEEFDGMGVS